MEYAELFDEAESAFNSGSRGKAETLYLKLIRQVLAEDSFKKSHDRVKGGIIDILNSHFRCPEASQRAVVRIKFK